MLLHLERRRVGAGKGRRHDHDCFRMQGARRGVRSGTRAERHRHRGGAEKKVGFRSPGLATNDTIPGMQLVGRGDVHRVRCCWRVLTEGVEKEKNGRGRKKPASASMLTQYNIVALVRLISFTRAILG